MKNKRIRFGIIGAGSRGVRSFGAYLLQRPADAGILALADINPVRLGAAGEMLGGIPNLFTDYNELLKMDELDAVIITTPDRTHEEIATAALEAKRNVLCEKPLAITVRGCRRILAEAERAGTVLEVGFVLRYVHLFKKIKDIIDSGRIGPVRLINAIDFYHGGSSYFRRWNRLKEVSGGLLIHKGSHDFDLLNWYAGSEPRLVSAFGGLDVFKPSPGRGRLCRDCENRCPEFFDIAAADYSKKLFLDAEQEDGYVMDVCVYNSDKDTYDNAVANVFYENGIKASYTECFFPSTSRRTFTIVGDQGEIQADEALNKIRVLYRYKSEVEEIGFSGHQEGHGGGDQGQMESFLESVRTGNQGRAGGLDGLRAVAVGQAAEISAMEHRIVDIAEL